jgi:hypothetical protein
LINKWIEITDSIGRLQGKRRMQKNKQVLQNQDGGLKILSISNFVSLICILAVGCCAGILVFFGELIGKKIRQ